MINTKQIILKSFFLKFNLNKNKNKSITIIMLREKSLPILLFRNQD